MISVQTDSAWTGFAGRVDGLEIELTSGDVGRVDFRDGRLLQVVPSEVSDESLPRVSTNVPPRSGKHAWQGPASGKVN